MNFNNVNAFTFFDMFLLLLIGIGPKIALVPFLEATESLPAATRGRMVRTMLTTATGTALVLIVFGGFLTKLLHFSTGALGIASGVILLIIAGAMVLSTGRNDREFHTPVATDPLQLAVFPLAIPYLLNPVGIVVLITVSAEAATIGVFAQALGALAVVLALDIVVFRWANRLSKHLDASRMLVTEKVFGFLLAALAVELILTGLAGVGALHLSGH